MYILLAVGNITALPEIGEKETLHIISTPSSTIPVTAFQASSGKKELHLIQDKADITMIALEIGYIAGSYPGDQITLFCQTDAQVKTFDRKKMDNKTIIASLARKNRQPAKKTKASASKEDPVKETAEPQKAETPKQAEKRTTKKPVSKNSALKNVPEKYHEAVIKAAKDASDKEIGFPTQLQKNLVHAGCEDITEIKEITDKVKDAWESLRK